MGITATVPSVTSAIEAIDVSLERSQREEWGMLGSLSDGESVPQNSTCKNTYHAIGNTYNTT